MNASRVVKAFVREDYEIDKFHDISKYVYNLFTKAEKIVAWNSPVMQFTMYSVVLIMVLIRRQEHHCRHYGDRRTYKCHRLRTTDYRISDDGYICIRYDHDRGGIF